MRGTLGEVPAVIRAVLHALQLAHEDVRRWCDPLSDEELNARPAGLPSIAFHVKHIAGSLDRLLTYAENRELSPEQVREVEREIDFHSSKELLWPLFDAALERSFTRIQAFVAANLEQPRAVGRKKLPTSLAGLLVHVADHTQRHVGQIVTTAKVLLNRRHPDP
jgi:uncharacterized damage-inducible protein DinB